MHLISKIFNLALACLIFSAAIEVCSPFENNEFAENSEIGVSIQADRLALLDAQHDCEKDGHASETNCHQCYCHTHVHLTASIVDTNDKRSVEQNQHWKIFYPPNDPDLELLTPPPRSPLV